MKMMMKDLIAVLDEISPESSAEEWDNGGFLIGETDKEISKIMIALEPSLAVIDEAVESGADLLIVHHPLIFSPLSSITDMELSGKKIIKLVKNSVALYAAHTSFDVADGGNNDYFIRRMGLSNAKKIQGVVGSFAELESPLSPQETAMLISEKLDIPLNEIKISSPEISGGSGEYMIKKIAVCTGAGADMAAVAADCGCDCLITGDVRYHAAMDAVERGFTIIDAGHYGTEKIFSENMREKLLSVLQDNGYKTDDGSGMEIVIAANQISPFSCVI